MPDKDKSPQLYLKVKLQGKKRNVGRGFGLQGYYYFVLKTQRNIKCTFTRLAAATWP